MSTLGDGTVETIHFAPDLSSPVRDASYVEPTHQYGLPTSDEGYQVSVSGGLDQVFHLETISVYASDIDNRNLNGLQNLTLFGMPINGLLDLSSSPGCRLYSSRCIDDSSAYPTISWISISNALNKC